MVSYGFSDSEVEKKGMKKRMERLDESDGQDPLCKGYRMRLKGLCGGSGYAKTHIL